MSDTTAQSAKIPLRGLRIGFIELQQDMLPDVALNTIYLQAANQQVL
jgi:hypothetical protein